MMINPVEFGQTIKRVFAPGHEHLFKGLLKYLRQSRLPFLKSNGFFLAIFQRNLIDAIVLFQSKVKQLNKEKRRAMEKGIDTSDIDTQLLLHKHTLRVIHTIADGIAVRAFDYNRPVLRLMSEDRNNGHLVKDSQDYPALLKSLLSSFRGIRIVNDITRYLRIGDVTIITSPKNIWLYEAKTNIKTGKTKLIDLVHIERNTIEKGEQPTKQLRKLHIAQRSIINKRISIPKDGLKPSDKYEEKLGIEILDLTFPVKSHLKTISTLLRKNRQTYFTSIELEPGYFVAILNLDYIGKRVKDVDVKQVLSDFEDLHPEWTKETTGRVLRMSNLQTFTIEDGEFARNSMPYSVFPFAARDCLRLMTGDVYIGTFVDTEKLKERYEKAGWQVEDGDFFEYLNNDKPFEKYDRKGKDMFSYKDPVLFKLSKDSETAHGIYATTIPVTLAVSAMDTFHSFDFLVDAIDGQHEQSKLGEKRCITLHFVDESDWYI